MSTAHRPVRHAGDPLENPNRGSDPTRVSDLEGADLTGGLFAIARSIDGLADAVDRLGTNSADTGMGAIELLARELRDGLAAVSNRHPEGATP